MLFNFPVIGSTHMRARFFSKSGFTLLELLVTIGIIGTLAATALPAFLKYQRRARTTEARVGLAAIYSAERSYFEEYNGYYGALDAIGFASDGPKRYYNIGFPDVGTPPLGAPTGTVAYITNTANGHERCDISGSVLPTATTFNAIATGKLGPSTAMDCDIWSITEQKQLNNLQIGL